MTGEENLEKFLQKYDEKNYYQAYLSIQNAVKDIWKIPRLPWYTDHGIDHSERIICHLNNLCFGLTSIPGSYSEHYGLTVEEVFLLLSAAWLHDIGMQDLSDLSFHSVDEMDNEDWEKVRKRHPEKAFEMIMKPGTGERDEPKFSTGIKINDDFRIPLALICKGHSSKFFEEVISQFPHNTLNIEGKGKKIRGELLTALLLMADELDLHYKRALFKENYPLSNVSKLHHFRHHYIGHVEVVPAYNHADESQCRRINIVFRFPPVKDNDREWIGNIQEWVIDKIETEALRTAQILHTGFNRHFLWENPIVTIKTETAFESEKLTMDKPIQYLLKTEIQKNIDWKTITKEMAECFKERKGGIVLISGGHELGIDRFTGFINSIFCASQKCENPDSQLAVIDFSRIQNYHTVDDIFEEIENQLQGSSVKLKPDSIIQHLQTCQDFHLVIFKNLDKLADLSLLNAIHEKIINPCRKKTGNLFLLITSENSLSQLSGINTYRLPEKFEDQDIYEYFIDSGDSEDVARSKQKEYLELMKFQVDKTPIISGKIVNHLKKWRDKKSDSREIHYGIH